MKIQKLKPLVLFFMILGFINIFQNKSYADYSYDVTSDVWSTETNDSTFELTADSEEISCSAGGGSTPSMWIGSMAGNGNTNANDFDG